MSLRVAEPGLLSLLVDGGRTRWRALGVPLGGAADRAAFSLGNALVGSPPDALALEITLAGPSLEALHPTACVVFGAAFALTVNGREQPAGTTFTMKAGDTLTVGGTATGVRGYLCVAGGFDAPTILGSRSTLDPLRKGDVLACGLSRCESRSLGFAAGEPTTAIRVLAGPQRDWFADDSFFTQTYAVSPASNRMGLRLKGEPLRRRPGELVSEAVAPGAVQVTNDGLPVVLGVDGQTIGGYPKVAHVIRADLDGLAQLRPGASVRFVRVTPEEAETAARERAAYLGTWMTRLRAAERARRAVDLAPFPTAGIVAPHSGGVTMKTWIFGGLLVTGAVAAGVYFVPPKPVAPAPTPAVVEAAPEPVAAVSPVVLADVVNVTNIDALLDPPRIPVADAVAPPTPVVVSMFPDHVAAIRPALPPTIPAASD